MCIYQVRSQLSWWWWGGGIDNLYTLEISSGWLKEYSVNYNNFFGCIIVLLYGNILRPVYIMVREFYKGTQTLATDYPEREVSVERCT